MKIKKISIENFRSIWIEEIIFPESWILALVWPNNAWKSNIMKAIYNILWDNWFNWERAELNDFFMKNKDFDIKIKIIFTDWKRVEFDSKEGWASYFSASNQKINQWNIPEWSTWSVKDDFPCTLLPANRSLEKNLQFRSYELMGKIAKKFNEKAKERKVELETKFWEVMDILNAVDWFSGFKSDFIDFFNEMQSDSPYKLKVDFKAFSPLNYFKTINILANDSSVDEEFNIDIEELWEWNKSLILFSLLRSYAKNMKQEATGILAIEEPEIYLHPQARRHLYSIFQEIVRESNIQIIYTTHSPDFISTEEFDSLWLVSKHPEEWTQLKIVTKKELVDFSVNTWVPINKTNIENIKSFYSSTSNFRLNEWFFAKKLFLVEWETEEFCLPLLFSIFWIDCNSKWISIIWVNWKNQIPKYWRLFKSFWIDCYVIFDNDKKNTNDCWNSNIASCFNVQEADIENLWPWIFYKSINAFRVDIFEQKLSVFWKDFENALKEDFKKYCEDNRLTNNYDTYLTEANTIIKPTWNWQKWQISRFVVKEIIKNYTNYKPKFIEQILLESALLEVNSIITSEAEIEISIENIPF